MNVLALDLGTKTGYAYNNDGYFECGTWLLATPSELREQKKYRGDRRLDRRVTKLFERVKSISEQIPLDTIIFEDVQFSSTTYQTQLWASLRAVVWLACPPNVGCECVPVGTLKKFAGHGGATKEMMGLFLCRANTRFCRIGKSNPKFFFRKSEEQVQPVDDNAIDAVWLHRWAQHNLSRK